jgi:hypothetical protein
MARLETLLMDVTLFAVELEPELTKAAYASTKHLEPYGVFEKALQLDQPT